MPLRKVAVVTVAVMAADTAGATTAEAIMGADIFMAAGTMAVAISADPRALARLRDRAAVKLS
jgi:hypothetical protein